MYAEKHKLLIETSNVEKTLKGLPSALAKQKEKILSISIKRPSLNDVFESVVKGK